MEKQLFKGNVQITTFWALRKNDSSTPKIRDATLLICLR